MRRHTRPLGTFLSVVVTLAIGAVAVGAQDRMPDMGQSKGREAPPATVRITMDELHAQGGVPRGWKFLIPPGDPAEGRKVFVAMECFACHEVKGEDVPRDTKTPRGVGPALTGMGAHHPAEYFAESILNPNRVIVQGAGYTGADGLSKMPSYADTMTLKQLVDVVAYLKSLDGSGSQQDAHSTHDSMKMNGSMKKR